MFQVRKLRAVQSQHFLFLDLRLKEHIEPNAIRQIRTKSNTKAYTDSRSQKKLDKCKSYPE